MFQNSNFKIESKFKIRNWKLYILSGYTRYHAERNSEHNVLYFKCNMIIFLYGEDSFRRKRKYTEIISIFATKNGNLGLSEFSTDGVESFLEVLKNRSIFSPRTLVSIKDIDFNALPDNILEVFIKSLLEIINSQEIIVLISSIQASLPVNMPFLNSLPSKTQEFSFLPKEKLVFFVAKEASMKGLELSDIDIRALIASFSGDLWAIDSELQKLASAQSLDIYSPNTAPSYFELLNTIKFSKTREAKLVALETALYLLKEDPARVFNGLAYSAPKGTLPGAWFSIMADYDVAVKSGRMDYEEALLDFVIR